jgi:hypothetical protein
MITTTAAIVGGVVGLVLAFAIFQLANSLWLIAAARDEGRAMERADALKKSLELMQKRSETNVKSAISIALACALPSVASGCQKTTSANDGAGFEALTPSAETRSFLITNDQPFGRQVAGHNRTCAAQPGCRK